MVLGNPTSANLPWVDELSTDPRDLRRHIYIYVRMYYIFINGYYVVVFSKLTKIEDDHMVNLLT